MSHLKSKALQKLSSDQTNPFISSQTKHADKHNEFSTLFLLQRQKLSQQSKKKKKECAWCRHPCVTHRLVIVPSLV